MIDNILNQLWEIYNKCENWHQYRLTEEDFKSVKKYLIEKNCLFVEMINNEVIAYCETWCITYSQWGRITCDEMLYTYDEDLKGGNIAYISNLWINPDYQNSKLIESMTSRFTNLYGHCNHVALRRKHGEPFRTYRMDRIKKFNKIGV